MNFNELLKQFLVEDEKVTQLLNLMKENKIYTTNQENLDTRYQKLNDQFNAKDQELKDALALNEQLKNGNAVNDDLQAKITAYETQIAELQENNTKLTRESETKLMLLSNHAKAEDVDYLMFKIANGQIEVKYDENGKITNAKEVTENLQTSFPNQFDKEVQPIVDVTDLPQDDSDKETLTKEEFKKMSYEKKAELFENNKELYDEMTKK